MKKVVLLILIANALFTSCSKTSTPPANSALLMFFHGCVSGTTQINIDGKVNSTAVVSNLGILKNSGYQYVTAANNANVSLFVSGSTSLISGTLSFTANSNYSVFAGGTINKPILVIVNDNLTAPASGNAKVRFVNLSTDSLNENCYVGSTKIDSNVGYGAVTPFFELAATTANVIMQDLSPANVTKIPSSPLNGQNFVAGKFYTIILTGNYVGSGSSALNYSVINNN